MANLATACLLQAFITVPVSSVSCNLIQISDAINATLLNNHIARNTKKDKTARHIYRHTDTASTSYKSVTKNICNILDIITIAATNTTWLRKLHVNVFYGKHH